MRKLLIFIMSLLLTFNISAQNFGHTALGNRFGGASSDGYLPQGYRGMVETAHGCGFYNPSYCFKFTTTHGYQFNKYLFLGGFVSVGTTEYRKAYLNGAETGFNFRVGSDFRVYLLKGKISPFLGNQLALDISPWDSPRDHSVQYYEPDMHLNGQLGVRFAINRKMGVSLAAQIGSNIWSGSMEALVKVGFEF